MKLKGPNSIEAETSSKGIFESLTTAVTDIFQSYSEPKHKSNPQPQTYQAPAPQNEFYFDKVKGTWVINGKEADTEYDMGQEPVKEQTKIEEVAPPPISSGIPLRPNKEEVVPESGTEFVSESFGKVKIIEK